MTIEQRLNRLERSNRRLRLTVSGLAVLVGVGFLAGMNASEPDEMTLRKLSIVDGEGTKRIVLNASLPNDNASVIHYDKEGTMRIGAVTSGDGNASVIQLDTDGKMRILAGTFDDGSANVHHYDKDGKIRILAATSADGTACLIHSDKDGKERITAGTKADGTADVTRTNVTVKE